MTNNQNNTNNLFAQYFIDCHTEAEVRSIYRQLAMKHHPDHGGSDEDMKLINAAYQEALKAVDGTTTTWTDNAGHERETTYHYNEEDETALILKMMELMSLKTKIPNIKVYLIGRWLWVAGTNKEDKDLLNRKGAGLKWSDDKAMWYWHKWEGYRHYRGDASLMSMAKKYGCQEIQEVRADDRTKRIAA